MYKKHELEVLGSVSSRGEGKWCSTFLVPAAYVVCAQRVCLWA